MSADGGEALKKPAEQRRRFLRRAALGALGVGIAGYAGFEWLGSSQFEPPGPSAIDRRNFHEIYSDPALKAQFRLFLANVFHLYPEDAFHALIARTVSEAPSDPVIYQRLAHGLPELEPFLGAFRYALPALRKQKRVMAEQTLRLLGERRRFEGYLELGSHGRYLDALEDQLQIEGPIFTWAPKPPTHSPEDIVDRGRLSTFGEALAWTDYQPFSARAVGRGSLELVTVYIGFHHCPVDQREAFITSIRDAMAPGGKLVLRDHDVTTQSMDHLVGLAHDVFNVGTKESLAVNAQELRNFYPLSFIIDYLSRLGFHPDAGRLRQDGDPTLNTLLSFSKA
jgi:hypothetical protein